MQPNTVNNNTNTLPTVTPQEQANIDVFNQGLKSQGVNSEFVTGKGVINSDVLKNTQPKLKLPEPTASTVATGIIGATEANLQQAKDSVAKQQELDLINAKNQASQAKADYSSVVDQIMGVQNSRSTLESNANIPKLSQEATDITNQIETTQRAYQNELKALDSAGLTDAGRASASRDISRKYASQLADLSIIQDVKNRNLTTAQTNIDRKIQLQLEPLKLKADYLKTIYEDNKDILTKSEDRAFQTKIKEEDRNYKKEEDRLKTLEDTKLKYMDIATSIGKGTGVLSEMQKATSPEEVVAIAARNGVISIDDQLKAVQVQEKQLELNNLRNEASDMLGGNTKKADNLTAYSQQFADTGKLPSPAELKQAGLSVGQVTMFAKQMRKPDGALVSTNTGVKSSALSPAQEDGIIAMSEIVRQTLPSLQEKFPKLYTGLIGGLAGQVFTTQDRQDYLTFRQEFLNKLLKARSGATVTPQEYDRYSNLLPGEFNQSLFFGSDGSKKLNSLAKSMKQTLDNSLQSNQLSIYGYSTVNVGGVPRKVGELLDMNGTKLRVLPDGTLTDNI